MKSTNESHLNTIVDGGGRRRQGCHFSLIADRVEKFSESIGFVFQIIRRWSFQLIMSDQASSGDPSKSSEFKAGHAPASKNDGLLFFFSLWRLEDKYDLIFSLNSQSWRYACRCLSSSTNITRR